MADVTILTKIMHNILFTFVKNPWVVVSFIPVLQIRSHSEILGTCLEISTFCQVRSEHFPVHL